MVICIVYLDSLYAIVHSFLTPLPDFAKRLAAFRLRPSGAGMLHARGRLHTEGRGNAACDEAFPRCTITSSEGGKAGGGRGLLALAHGRRSSKY